jgi:hypothetical protein
MKRVAPSDDDLDWNQLEMQALILKIRLQEAAEQHQKLTKDIKEQSSILPPSELLKSMAEAKEHDELATRSEERDFRRKQRAGVVLTVALIVTAVALAWWGIRIVKGG